MSVKDAFDTRINTPVGPIIGGMYYYFIKESDAEKCSAITGNCPAVHSCYWSPILEAGDVKTDLCTYDIERYGKLQGWSLNYTPYVERIREIKIDKKKLAVLKKYNLPERVPYRSWKNESRLFLPPYSYSMLTDYLNPPLEIRANEVRGNDLTIYAKAFVSDKGTYSYYVEGLKGDFAGNMEMQVSTAPTDIPVGSTAFATWSATQKATDNHNYTQALLNNGVDNRQNEFNQSMGLINSGVGVIGSLLGGNIGNALMSGFGGYQNYMNSEFGGDKIRLQQKNIIGSRSAMMKDLSNTPRTMFSTGSDVGFSMINGHKRIDLIRYTLTDEFKERLGDYFALYGYKQAKVMKVDFQNRYYYNYIKTVNANIIPNRATKGIPKIHLEEIRQLFDKGLTFWHVYNEGVYIDDFSKDNKEV